MKAESRDPRDERETYQRPRLITFGDFRTLTKVKGGRLGDGINKGNSRLKGSKSQ